MISDGSVSVDRYLDNWIPAAKAIVRGGGLVGFGSMAPGGDMNDQDFLRAALAGLKQRGATNLLNRGWLSMHNYTLNHPVEEQYVDGFFKFRTYNKILRDALGRDLPIIGTITTGNNQRFGSYHPGICNFVFGDAAVRSLSVTTPEATLGLLVVRDDGLPVPPYE